MTIYKKSKLTNGIRVVTEKIPYVKSVSVGIWVGAGSRFEDAKNSGISHFIEHLLFKGTEKRSAKEIAEALDTVGGQLNAFTSKEYTCFYARVLDEHLDIALDVLSDMFFNSKLKEEDIDKERQVIIEEINMYEDTPDEIIHDIFTKTVWPEHPLGRAILGTEESLNSITRQDIIEYMNKLYKPDNIVLALAGNVEHNEVLEQLEVLFGFLENEKSKKTIIVPDYKATLLNTYKDINQVHICLGTPGLAQDDPKLYELAIFNSVLGGSLSSRLVQEIREERGLAYSVFSYHSAFIDTGLLNFYAGTRPSNYEKVIKLIFEESQKIVKEGITDKELYKTKEQLKGSLYLGLESVSSRMTRIGRSLLCLDEILTPEETVEKVEKVKLDDIRELAKTLLAPENFSITTIGPIKDMKDKDYYLN
ncbi:Predicted Zn-dependent peptidase [Desulfonispora thiosulfatigenes DSM 11270]|uniref:Predicted Zn-dependent peptidase n=1 Tax=Desulfonispora thiosulfatigenes DSM 11270 TaxID=656914 RepID=A0A1W1VL82_DESTI|nr:pitrilysin family protein [Desulfonispora thiosulfatigenes]SMB94145.1 Predicted Zn-dependent peptidase [Desulfonispora thiosulfatigenes DSM 11270]